MKNIKNTPVEIPVSKLHPFAGHPYKVIDNEEMNFLIDSIQTQGILSPLIVRPLENTENEYEVVSGHRRLHAAIKAGLKTVPAIVYAMERDAAAIAVVDSNLHREHILPSEKAFAYKMKYDAVKHQGKPSQLETKQRTDEMLGADAGESRAQIQRYIRLTHLIPELLQWMDEGKIALSVGVELSYLPDHFQYDVHEICVSLDCTPSFSQSWHLHQDFKSGVLDKDLIFQTLSTEKANQRETIKIPMDRLRKYIPKNYTPQQAVDYLVKAADYLSRYLRRQKDQQR